MLCMASLTGVSRIFERGDPVPASEASALYQGSEGAAPSGVQGLGRQSPPEKFLGNFDYGRQFNNKEKIRKEVPVTAFSRQNPCHS